MTSPHRMAAAALLIPLALVGGWLLFVSIAERAGVAAGLAALPRNSAEAAAMGMAAEVVRFLRAGEDPHQVYAVRPQIISSAVRHATTLEAAMWSRQLELIELLEREGALTAADRRPLACLAGDLGLEDVAEHLGDEGAAPCVDGEGMDAVLARSSRPPGGATGNMR